LRDGDVHRASTTTDSLHDNKKMKKGTGCPKTLLGIVR